MGTLQGERTDAAPGADPDLDGADNANEFAFATNPLDSNSVSRLTAETSANELQLVWPTRLGIVYSVESTHDFVSWSSIVSATPGTGRVIGTPVPGAVVVVSVAICSSMVYCAAAGT